jgi:hypothetical protein
MGRIWVGLGSGLKVGREERSRTKKMGPVKGTSDLFLKEELAF